MFKRPRIQLPRHCATLLFAILCIGMTTSSAANPFKRDIAQEGNEAFRSEDYEKATAEYVKAQDLEPLSAELNFNLGSAYYRQEEFERAKEYFEKATRADEASMAGQAYYNLGNARYKAAKRDFEAAAAAAGGEDAAGGAVQDYIKKLEECVKDYEETLKRAPDDEDAKYNLEMIRREIKNLMRRQPPQDQQQQDDQKQNQEEQNQEQEEGESQEQEDQQSGEQQENENQGENEEKQSEQSEEQEQQERTSQEQGEEGTPTPQPQLAEGEPTPTPGEAANMEEGEGEPTAMPTLTISEEMARNLLDNLPEQRPRARRQRQKNVEKDW